MCCSLIQGKTQEKQESKWEKHLNHIKYSATSCLLIPNAFFFFYLSLPFSHFFLCISRSHTLFIPKCMRFFLSTSHCFWSRSFLYICIVIVQLAITRRRVLLESNEKAHFFECDSNSTETDSITRCMDDTRVFNSYVVDIQKGCGRGIVLIWIIYIKASTMIFSTI